MQELNGDDFQPADQPLEPSAGRAGEGPSDVQRDLDEVLVFQMDDEEDGPHLPEGMEGDDVATYGAPPPEAEYEEDEFTELGEAWQARLAGEDGEEPFDEEEFEPVGADSRKLAVVAAVAGALAAVVLFFLEGDPSATTDEPVANVERTAPADPSTTPPVTAGGAAGTGSTTDPTDTEPTSTEPPVRREPREPRSMVAGLQNLFGTFRSGPADTVGPQGAGTAEGPQVAARTGDERERREGTIAVADQVVLPGPLPNLQMADPTQFGAIWPAETLPEAGVQHASFVQTPLYGPARVHTGNEEFFDGRLVGLGAGRLVLRTVAGELTLRAEQVAGIERLMDEETPSGTLVASTSGERVRVRAPGGWIRGEVVRRDAETVTLMLESGGRVTVDREDVRPALDAGRVRLSEPPPAG